MAGIRIEGSISANVAEVNNSNQLIVTAETNPVANPGNIGAFKVVSEQDAGTITGTRLLEAVEVTDDSRQRIVGDVILEQETFNYANQNTAKHAYLSTTMTIVTAGAALTTNATAITTLNTGVSYRTFRYFPIFGHQTETYIENVAALSAAMATNTTIDFGLFITSGANPYAPTDGIYFRITSAGVIGVINIAGVETTTSAFLASFGGSALALNVNQYYSFQIAVTNRTAKFFINGVLYGSLNVQTANGQLFQSQYLPWQVRHAIGGTAAGSVVQFKIQAMCIQSGDVAQLYDIATLMVAQGGSNQVQQGASTGGQLTTYALGAEPGAVTLTASTAPATNTLGGIFVLPVAITVAASDFPLFAWQNLAGTNAIPGKPYVVRGIHIGDLIVGTALVGGPIALCWAFGWGSTAATLATTETTSFTATTTKIARKETLNVQVLPATAAVGTLAAGFYHLLPAPRVINPGEFLHIILRVPYGTSTTAGLIRGEVRIDGHFL